MMTYGKTMYAVLYFEPLLREWAGEERSHAGVILVPASVKNEAFGVLISSIQNTLAETTQEGWIDRVKWLRRNGTE